MNDIIFTIITPTYNRAHTLDRVFSSLVAQTFMRFEWLVIDDGSVDNTRKLIENYAKTAPFPVRYFFQSNGGKHRALNLGFKKAHGRFVLAFDSDDWCVPQALERFWDIWQKLPEHEKERCCGISALKVLQDGTIVGDAYPPSTVLRTYIDRFNLRIRGDKWELIRRDLCLAYPYPEIDGENYVAPSYPWLQMGRKYNTVFSNEKLSVVEYLNDGISKNNILFRSRNPKGCSNVYELQFELSTSFPTRLKSAINFYRFFLHGGKFRTLERYTLLGFIIGFFFFISDKIRLKKKKATLPLNLKTLFGGQQEKKGAIGLNAGEV